MFLFPLGERLGEGVQLEDCLLHNPLTQPLPQGGEEHDHSGHSHAAPRTPLESPCFGGSSRVAMWSGSEKT
jgi:hypothetical protein